MKLLSSRCGLIFVFPMTSFLLLNSIYFSPPLLFMVHLRLFFQLPNSHSLKMVTCRTNTSGLKKNYFPAQPSGSPQIL